MRATFTLDPIGFVRGGRADPVDDDWGAERCAIDLDARFSAESIAGLEEFSHLEVVYVLDRVPEASIETGARHPRGRLDWPRAGIFAQRGKARPNRLGVSRCRLVGIEGTRVLVQGLDAVDGTPVVDLKPYMREFGPRGQVMQPAWATELMADYWERGTGHAAPSEVFAVVDVDDLQRGIDFYTRAFALRLGRRFGAGAAELVGAPTTIHLLEKAAGTVPSAGAEAARSYARHWTPVHLDFVVSDVEDAVRRTVAAGARLEGGVRTAAWGRIAGLADPFGHGICVLELRGRGYDELL